MAEAKFTQDDVNAIVQERVAREKRKQEKELLELKRQIQELQREVEQYER